jgi:ElaB/YqjD/DUF883 family membrane-anchored ribosome-binding protein
MGFFNDAIQKLDGFNQEVSKRAINAVAEANKHIGKRVGDVVEAAKKFEWEATANGAKSWIEKHPGQVAGITAAIVAPPLAIAAVPAMLGGLGFTAAGVAAGKCALLSW